MYAYVRVLHGYAEVRIFGFGVCFVGLRRGRWGSRSPESRLEFQFRAPKPQTLNPKP